MFDHRVGDTMDRTIVALEMIRELNLLSRSLRVNEVHITAAYARLAGDSRLGFGGITATDALVLETIGDNPQANGQCVAERIGLTKGGVSKILAKLQEKGLIRGEKDKSDYKSIFYSLTDAGLKARAFHEKMLLIASTEIHNLISGLSERELGEIRRFIYGLTEALGSISKNLEKMA